MKRVAITGSPQSGKTALSHALSVMTGFDLIVCSPFPLIALRYKIDPEHTKCQWPDTFLYNMSAFTERMIAEQRFVDRFISDGSVLHELAWVKSRNLHHDPIYEQPVIHRMEQVLAKYASNGYDHIFHINAPNADDAFDQCIRQIYTQYGIRFDPVDGLCQEEALEQMIGCLKVRPVSSPEYALQVKHY